MARSVVISTPIPSADEVAEQIGMSKSRLRRIRQIVNDAYPLHVAKKPSKILDERHRDSDARTDLKRPSFTAASKLRSR
jgi:hypothetical protein